MILKCRQRQTMLILKKVAGATFLTLTRFEIKAKALKRTEKGTVLIIE